MVGVVANSWTVTTARRLPSISRTPTVSDTGGSTYLLTYVATGVVSKVRSCSSERPRGTGFFPRSSCAPTTSLPPSLTFDMPMMSMASAPRCGFSNAIGALKSVCFDSPRATRSSQSSAVSLRFACILPPQRVSLRCDSMGSRSRDITRPCGRRSRWWSWPPREHASLRRLVRASQRRSDDPGSGRRVTAKAPAGGQSKRNCANAVGIGRGWGSNLR